MEDKNTINWQQQAADEYNLREQAQTRVVQLTQELETTLAKLKSADNYSQYLRSKMCDLEAQTAEYSSKTHHVIELLKKAKQLILKRKAELNYLTQENAKLKAALNQKNIALESEMLLHQESNQKLANSLRKLIEVNAALKAKQQECENLIQENKQLKYAQTVAVKPIVRVSGNTELLPAVVIPAEVPSSYKPASTSLCIGDYFAHKAISTQNEAENMQSDSNFLKQLMFLQWFGKR